MNAGGYGSCWWLFSDRAILVPNDPLAFPARKQQDQHLGGTFVLEFGGGTFRKSTAIIPLTSRTDQLTTDPIHEEPLQRLSQPVRKLLLGAVIGIPELAVELLQHRFRQLAQRLKPRAQVNDRQVGVIAQVTIEPEGGIDGCRRGRSG